MRNGPFWISALLSALIAVELVRLSVTLFGGCPAAAPAPVLPRGSQTSRRPRLDVGAIVAAHVFGLDAQAAGTSAAQPESVAHLVLEGVVATSGRRGGVAIIRGDDGAKVYASGAPVGGAVLRSVFADHVLLVRDGVLETLSLPRFGGPASARAEAAPPAPPASGAVTGTTLGDVVRLGAAVPGAAGGLRGFRVFPRASRGAFAAAGLRGGDLVTAIDGKAVEELPQEDVQRVFDSVRGASRVRFTVENITGSHDVTVDLAQADADTAPSL